MKTGQLIVFLAIVFSVHALVNGYIMVRGLQALTLWPHWKLAFKVAIITFALAYPIGRWLEHAYMSPVSHTLHWMGAFWFAFMLYITMPLILIDITRLILHSAGKWHWITSNFNMLHLKGNLFIAIALISSAVVVLGHINAWHPHIVKLDLNIAKKSEKHKTLKIVAVSDIHLGTIIGPRKTGKMVDSINALHPDIILLAGDIVDEDVKPVIAQNLGKNLEQLKAPLGVWAIPGNHEYIGGSDASIKYISEHGVNVLQDSAVLIDSSFYIIGRDDKDKLRFKGTPRKELADIVKDLDKSKPLIMLDHQPFHLEDAENNGIDLQLSGHTHHGQLWPFNYVTDKIFEMSNGYHKKGETNYYVSSGFGTWGPPVRVGNQPEIVEITLHFE